ncbi:MAG: hypothetical protein KBH12_06330 [Synergistaceae bacterium]|nr:hypothetical protein [Synergistaceae bacterium]MBP9626006.1 hypothetical protein [Synergistaceae bacterium]MBP9956987.1 hypothetical protein [Synergistaceae bacterium]
MKALKVANRDRCIGCLSCMYACSRLLRNSMGTGKAALRIRSYPGVEGSYSLRVCARCEDPDCARACPTGALSATAQGGVRLDRDKCNSCAACVEACAIKAMQWDEEERMPLPCVHCGRCTTYCPNGVLVLADRGGEQ